jgi:hypothetical protein
VAIGIVGGAGLFILGGLGTVLGVIAGVVVGAIGLASLSSKDPADKTAGTVITAAGALAIASKIPIFGGLAKFALGLGAVALLGTGIWYGIKFLKGLKARS